MKSKVALVKGNSKEENLKRALELIEDEINISRPILIKPNFVSTTIPLAATPVETVRTLIDFLMSRGQNEFIIGEASSGNTNDGFANFGYYELKKKYPVKLVDLNQDRFEKKKIFDREFNPIEVRIARTPLHSYRISVTRPKTHDTVIVTLSLKNMIVGSLIGEDKGTLHQGFKAINLNLVHLAKYIFPNLSLIDGWVGMEGDGPSFGKAISLRVAVASTNPLACDMVVAKLMGFDPNQIGYLWYLSQLGFGPKRIEDVEILGNKIEECKAPFSPHSRHQEMLNWKIDNWQEILKTLKQNDL
ncbi:DUF362 domain-containing protein [Patescibacteria group bacterium]|nr:DUF362 domain-containing protein [Patescibacteria group bacterium]